MTCVEVHAEWDGRAWLLTPPTGFISACFSPSHTGYMAARPGTSTYGSFQPQRPCSTISLGMHLHTGHAAVGGAQGGPRGRTSSRRPRWWSACILYGRYGHIGRLSVSPIQIVCGFPPYVLYGQRSAYFQKWTRGGKTTLIFVYLSSYVFTRYTVPGKHFN